MSTTFKEKFNIARQSTRCFVLGSLSGALCISVMGLGAHFARYCTTDELASNYSLKNRFETAYSFKTPAAHKRYVYFTKSGGMDDSRYIASPYLTYPAIFVYGLLAGAMGASTARYDNESKRRLAAAKCKQNVR